MIDAKSFIPHAQPMVFVDHLIEANDTFAVVELKITPDLMFYEAEGLPTWTSIELMAQAVSVYAGYKGHSRGEQPKVGYLLGTRKLQLPFAYFTSGEIVQIRVEQHYLHEGLGQFNCEIMYQAARFSAVLSVYEPTNNDAEN